MQAALGLSRHLLHLVGGLLFCCLLALDGAAAEAVRNQNAAVVQAENSYTGEIVILPDDPVHVREYLQAIPRDGLELGVKLLGERDIEQSGGSKRFATVLFLIAQDLPVGTTLQTSHQFQRYNDGKRFDLGTYDYFYEILTEDDGKGPHLILNTTYTDSGNGYIVYRLYIDDALALTRRVAFPVR